MLCPAHPQKMDAYQVPEGRRLLGLFQEYVGAQFGQGAVLKGPDGLIRRGPPLTLPDIRRFVVEPSHEIEEDRSPGNSGNPEGPTQTERIENEVNHQDRGYGAQPLQRLQYPHGEPQPLAEPEGDARNQGDLESRHTRGKKNAEVEVELPELGHGASQDHSGNKEQAAGPHHPAYAVTVPQPPAHRAQGAGDDPLDGEADGNRADAPSEVLRFVELRDQQGDGEAQGRTGHPHNGRHADDHPSVMETPVSNRRPLWTKAEVKHPSCFWEDASFYTFVTRYIGIQTG